MLAGFAADYLKPVSPKCAGRGCWAFTGRHGAMKLAGRISGCEDIGRLMVRIAGLGRSDVAGVI